MSDLEFIITNKKYSYYILLGRLKNYEDAEDCYQRLLIRAFENKTSLDGKINYLVAALNQEVSRFKRTDAVFQNSVHIDFDGPYIDNLEYEKELIYKKRVAKETLKNIKGLGAKILSDRLSGYTMDQIITNLQIDKDKANVLFSNAMKTLKQLLKESP